MHADQADFPDTRIQRLLQTTARQWGLEPALAPRPPARVRRRVRRPVLLPHVWGAAQACVLVAGGPAAR